MSAFGGAEVSLGPSPGAVSTVDFHRAAFVSRQRHPGVFWSVTSIRIKTVFLVLDWICLLED